MNRLAARLRRTIAIAVVLLLSPFAGAQELDDAFARDAIVIVGSAGECYHFDVWLALTVEQQRRGLMYVRDLPAFRGMLFVYQETAPHSMWMKNTLIPLDILFIKADGEISSIVRRTEPQSLRSIASTEPVTFVLELGAGATEALGIDEQSRVLLPADLSITQPM